MIFNNLKKVLKNKSSLFATTISIIAISSLFFYFGNSELVIGNLGYNYYLIELNLDIFIAVLFGLFVGSTIYKMLHFSKSNKKTIGVGGIASFFGVLVGGCPACSITLASYLGLASLLSVFPYHGLELKILSFMMLLYVVYDILNTLEVCKIKK